MIKKNNRTDDNNVLIQVLEFLKKNWFLIVACVMAYPMLKRYMDDQAQKTKENTADNAKVDSYVINQNPLTQQQRRDKITTRKDIQKDATLLAHHLGTKYSDAGTSWFGQLLGKLDPKGWTENDKEVRTILIKERLNIAKLEALYYRTETNSRNLRADVLNYLDTAELKEVQKFLKI
jgi:hypothetical protein